MSTGSNQAVELEEEKYRQQMIEEAQMSLKAETGKDYDDDSTEVENYIIEKEEEQSSL